MSMLSFEHAILKTRVWIPFPENIFYVYDEKESLQRGTRIVSAHGAVVVVKESVEEVKSKIKEGN